MLSYRTWLQRRILLSLLNSSANSISNSIRKKMLFFLSFFLRPLGGPDSRLQKYSKTVFLLYRRSVSQQFLRGFEVPSRGGGTENPGRPYFETLLWRKESVERFFNFLVTLIFLIIFLMHFSSPSSLTHFMLFSYNMIYATRSIFFLCRFSNDLHFIFLKIFIVIFPCFLISSIVCEVKCTFFSLFIILQAQCF